MDDNLGDTLYVTINDEDGNEFELEHLDSIEVDDQLFMAFLPADMDEDDDDFGIIILKVIVEDNEEFFVTVDDEKELEALYERFIERLEIDSID